MTGQPSVVDVLREHTIRGVRDGRWFCSCGEHWPVDLEGDSENVGARHHADVLAGARAEAERAGGGT